VWYAARVPSARRRSAPASDLTRVSSDAATTDATPARADRSAAIVQVAYRLIAERGLEGFRFADVAREAGINNGTLLYYFDSKDALIRAVGALMVEHFSETAAPKNPAAPSDPLAALRWEFADAAEHLQDRSTVVYTELLARAQRDPLVAALLRDIDAGWHGWLSSLLERGRQSGAMRADLDVSLAATTIMSAIRGVGMQAMIAEDPSSVTPVMTVISDLIEGWVAARPGS
jgi:AcrR family transcriptional regulator